MLLAVDPDAVPDGAAADLCNLDLARPRGGLTPRAGSRSLCRHDAAPNYGHPANPLGNAAWNYTADVIRLVVDDAGRRLFAIVRFATGNAKVHRADLAATGPGFDAGTASFALDTDRIPSAAIYKGALYIATGSTAAVDNRVVQASGNANAAAAQIETPLPPTATPSGSPGLLSGSYQYACLYRDSRTGSTGPVSGLDAAAPGDETVDVVVTKTTNPLVDKIDIYRTTAGGGTLRFVASVDNDGMAGTASYNDNIADDRLSYQTPPDRTGRPPTCRFCLVHGDRMLWLVRTEGGGDANVVYYSEVNRPYVVDPIRNVLTVRPDDGDQISGVGRLYNRVYVFKTRQIYELVDNRPTSVYRVDPVVNEGAIGCVAHATIVEIEGRLFFLSANGPALFDGQAARLIGGPIESAFAETNLRHRRQTSTTAPFELEAGALGFAFRNGDVATETFDFECAFFGSAATDPNVSGTGTALEVVTTIDQPEAWTVQSQPITGEGVELTAGKQVSVLVMPQTLQRGRTVFPWTRAYDGTQWTEWKPRGEWTFAPIQPAQTSINWGLASKFYAIDVWTKHEYWLFVASAGSTRIDQAWVLDYRTLDAEGGPQWRRHLIHATAAVMATGVNLDTDQQALSLPILGDALGCVWAFGTAGNTDHQVVRNPALTDAQRVIRSGRCFIDGDKWTLLHKTSEERASWLAATGGWPSISTGGTPNHLNGERVVVRDSNGAVYTGIITSNSPVAIDVKFWLEGRSPPEGRDLEFCIGGIDAHVDTYPNSLEDPDHVKIIRLLTARGPGVAERIEAELRLSNQPEALDSIDSLARLRRGRFREFAVGGGTTRRAAVGRAHFIGLRFGSWRYGHRWVLSAYGLGVIPTRSVH